METTDDRNKRWGRCGHRGRIAGWIVLGIVGVSAFILVFGAVIMWLWNALLPDLFHFGTITYWQAVGLAVLARLLFGSMHHGHSHGRHGKFSRWGYRRHGGTDPRCYPGESKWSYYDQYWNEEGEKAFNDYVARKSGQSGNA